MSTLRDLDELLASASRLQVVNYVEVSVAAFFLYDYLLTLDDEIKFIWHQQSKWGIAKVLFVLARYINFLTIPISIYHLFGTDIDVNTCMSIYRTETTLVVLGMTSAECVFLLRLCAIWERRKAILVFSVVTLLAGMVALAVLMVLFYSSLRFGPPPFPFMTGCYRTAGSKVMFGAFIVVMVSEGMVLCMTIYRARAFDGPIRSPLFTNLVRNGSLYCLLMFLLSLANVLVIFNLPVEYSSLLELYQAILHTTLATRMHIHLRKIDRKHHRRTVMMPLSSLCFVKHEVGPSTECH